MTDVAITYPDHREPVAFTQSQLDWLPWLPPLPAEELTDRHWAGLVDAARARSPYFMLLVRDPDILGARTRTDKDIFYNPTAGLPRAERELSAAAASRYNGCIYCASVHSRFSTQFSKRGTDLDRLLAEGVEVDLGPRWNAIVAASVALSNTPADPRRTTRGGIARRGAGRSGHLRRDPWCGVLQLGKPADALPRGAEGARTGLILSGQGCSRSIRTGWSKMPS